jgi:hypothetical protein
MTRLFLEMNDYDIRTRTADEGRVPISKLIQSHEVSQGGVLLRQDDVISQLRACRSYASDASVFLPT